MNPAILVGWLPIMGVVLGLLRVWRPRLPVIAAVALSALYLIALAVYGVWAARCWDCGAGAARSDALLLFALFFGLIVGATLLGIWLGARLTVVVPRLLGSARDVRDAARGDGPPAN
jgi:hypothetical protein